MPYDLGTFFLNLAITIFAYGVGPFLFASFRRKPIKRSAVRWFCIIYTVIIWFGFRLLGSTSTGGAALLWYYVFYRITIKILSGNGNYIDPDEAVYAQNQNVQLLSDTALNEPQPVPQPEYSASTESIETQSENTENVDPYYCVDLLAQLRDECEKETVHPASKMLVQQRSWKPQFIASCCVCVVLAAACIVGFIFFSAKTSDQAAVIANLEDQVTDLTIYKNNAISVTSRQNERLAEKDSEISALNNTIRKMRHIAASYDEREPKVFHKIDCDHFSPLAIIKFGGTSELLAKGYIPCEYCYSTVDIMIMTN